MFDPKKFGEAMAEEIHKAVAPLHAEIVDLKKQLAARPDFSDAIAKEVAAQVALVPAPKDGDPGKDCDMEAVKAMVTDLVKAIPAPKDGTNGKDCDMSAVQTMVSDMVKAIPTPKNGEKGADGVGLGGAMIDRDGVLLVTLTNGEVKSLGPVVGKDGTDGVDGIGLENFELEYLKDTHEIAIKATVAGRVKELRYPAGGIAPGGYWRDGTKAQAGECWVHDGSLWIAIKATGTKPDTGSADWIIAARRGRDGERGQKGQDGTPPAPIKLKD